jgi:hypothetical protein
MRSSFLPLAAAMISIIGKAATQVIAGVALSLAGCTAYQPPQYYPPTWNPPWNYSYSDDRSYFAGPRAAPPAPNYSWRPPIAAPAPHSSFSFIPSAEAAPAPQTPLRRIDPPEMHPVDPSCGWWRLCNLWSGS